MQTPEYTYVSSSVTWIKKGWHQEFAVRTGVFKKNSKKDED